MNLIALQIKTSNDFQKNLEELKNLINSCEENSIILQEVSASADEIKVAPFEERVYKQIQPLAGFGVRELLFSATSLFEYETCPRSFFYHYIAQLPGSEEISLEKNFYL